MTWGDIDTINEIDRLRAENAKLRAELQQYQLSSNSVGRPILEDNARLQAALEEIVRECGALNKGPVAVMMARKALANERGK